MSALRVSSSDASEGFVRRQHAHPLHLIVPWFYGLILSVGTFSPKWIILGMLFLLIATSLPLIWRNKLFLGLLLFVSVLSLRFPMLGPLFVIASIFFYFRRLLLLLKHRQLVFAGLAVYGAAFLHLLICGFTAEQRTNGFVSDYSGMRMGVAIVVGLSGVALFTRELRHLYRLGYPVKLSLSLMGVFPLIGLSLLMPIFKFELPIELPEIAPELAPPSGQLAPAVSAGSVAHSELAMGEALRSSAGQLSATAKPLGGAPLSAAGQLASRATEFGEELGDEALEVAERDAHQSGPFQR